MAENRICLNMIVKNESRIIERCIKSVYHLIDTWCIVDTGSTDGTQEIIKELLKDKPGELIESPWVNFGHNRNEALRHAERWGEWTLLTDADMVLVDDGFNKDELNPDVCGYDVIQDNYGTRYYNFRLLNSSRNWQCVGVTHEYYSPAEGMIMRGKLESLHFNDISDGGSKGDKFERDIALLEQGIIDEPENHRYMFYLAQSYRDTSNWEKAIHWYSECAKIDPWDEEKQFSEYMAGWCMCAANYPLEKIEAQLLKAWMQRPWRVEALFQLACVYRDKAMRQQAYIAFKICAEAEYPKNDLLFIAAAIYEGSAIDEFAISSYWAGKYEESAKACEALLGTEYGKAHKGRILKNYWYAEKQLGVYSKEKLKDVLEKRKAKVMEDFNIKMDELKKYREEKEQQPFSI